MRRKRNAFLIRLITAVTLAVSALSPLVTAPQMTLAAPNGSDIDVKWYGAEPSSYNHTDGSGGDSSNVVTSLQGGDFACGDHVIFFAVVEISDTATAGASTGVFNFNLGWETTNGTQIGFRVLNSITLATGDSQWNADNDNSTITAFSATPTPAVNPDNLVVSATISDLEPGETIIIKIDAGIVCAEEGTGNLPTSWGGGTVIAGGSGTIGGGAQTVTMKVDGIVLYDPVIVTMVSESQTQPGVGVTDTAIVSGPLGVPAPAGTVTFFACGPTASPEDCTTGGTQVGSPVTLVSNQAVSIPFVPTAEGAYCFRAEYTPAEGTPYNAGSHTNSSTECFTVVVPRGTIIVEKQTIPDGSPQSFTFTPSWGSSFSLTDGQSSSSGLLPAGTYSVSETVPSGWDLSSAVCSDGSLVSAIELSGGEEVTCIFTNSQRQDLTVTKTATASYDRTYLWAIDKTVDGATSQTIASGLATFGYNVEVNQTGFSDSGWTLGGTITVSNPNSFDVTGVTVTDVYPGGVCIVTGGTNVTVPANDAVTLSYACTFASQPAYSGTNTATATWDAEWELPSTSASGTAAVTFARDQEIDKTITVVDDKTNPGSPVTLDTLTAADAEPFVSQTYEYDLALPGVAGRCTSYTNTATIVETEQSDSQAVRVCVVQAPEVTKTAVESYTTTYTWTIDKSVDDDSQNVPAGGTATFDYSVEVEHDAGTNSLYLVTGIISVTTTRKMRSAR